MLFLSSRPITIGLSVLGVGIILTTGVLIRFLPIGIRSTTDLKRPLVVGISANPAFAGGIVANRGLPASAESIFAARYGQPVNLVFAEDWETRRDDLVEGGPDGVDVVWTTIESWAKELPEFVRDGVDARAILQVDLDGGVHILVARTEFLQKHPRAIDALVRGWLDGTEEARVSPQNTADLLTKNAPYFSILGQEVIQKSLTSIHLANLMDNIATFGLTGIPGTFERVYGQAIGTWTAMGSLPSLIPPSLAYDPSALVRMMHAAADEGRD